VRWAGLYTSLREWLALVVDDLTGLWGAAPAGFQAAGHRGPSGPIDPHDPTIRVAI